MPLQRLTCPPLRCAGYALTFGLAGFALNYFLPIPLYYKLSFLLGSIPALLALELISLRAGIAAAALAASATLLLWGQPLPLVALTTELAVIALLHRRLRSLLLSASIYWLAVGGPLILLFYHLAMETSLLASLVYALKFAVNGVFNALLASLILLAIRFVRFRKNADQELRLPFADALALLLTAVVFIPLLLATVISLRVELGEQERHLRTLARQTADSSQQMLQGWLQDRAANLEALRRSLEPQRGQSSQSELHKALQLLKASDPAILRMGVLAANGRVIAHEPDRDRHGQSVIGQDYSQRPHIAQALREQQPVISDVYRSGLMGSPPQVVAMVHPLIIDNQVQGYLTALLSLRQFEARGRFIAERRNVQLTVVDRRGEIVISSSPRPSLTARPGLSTSHPPKTAGTPWLEIMQQAHLVNRIPFGNGLPWEIIVETPYAPLIKDLNRHAAVMFGILFVLMSAVILAARYGSARFSRSIRELQQTTADLPLQISRGVEPVWPDSILQEVGGLTSNVRDMAKSLGDAFLELRTINDNLEQRVDERTAELLETTRNLETARNQAEAASAAKGRFLAMMSHEIRTPMNAIIGIAALLRQTELSQRQRELLSHAHDAANSLLQIINDILDFSRIEANRLEILTEPFSLRSLLDALDSLFREQAYARGLHLNVSIPPELPDLLLGDRGRLRQILSNLLANALKFTDSGEITLSVRQLSADATARTVRLRFELQDTGIGIPLEKQSAIFEMFSQVDDSSTRRFGGTGLGLAICRQLTELMGGTITVASAPGNGSCFTVELPYQTTDQAPPACPCIDARTLPRLRILLAEDHPVNQLVSRELLSSLGQEVVTVANGRLLLEEAARQPFDLILTDISMPEMDGYQAALEIRSGRAAGVDPRIPIIAMTAHALADDRQRILDAGIDGYVAKPVEIRELLEELRRTVPQCFADLNYAAETPVKEEAMTDSTLHATDDPLDRDYLERNYLALGCADVLADVVKLYLESHTVKLHALQDRLANGSSEELTKLAHGLKGESGSVGARFVMKTAAAIEQAARSGNRDEIARLLPELAHEMTRVREVFQREFPL